MEIELFKLNINNVKSLAAAVKRADLVLKNGGIVVHPTDTCYGIAADIANESALAKAYRFKGRDYQKPFSIIVNGYGMFRYYGEWNDKIADMIEQNPGQQYTFVVKRKKNVPAFFNPNIDTIGIQIPKYELSLNLLKKIGRPLIATSANLSGQPNNYSVDQLLEQLSQAEYLPDLIIDGGRLAPKPPSRVVLLKGDDITVLRN